MDETLSTCVSHSFRHGRADEIADVGNTWRGQPHIILRQPLPNLRGTASDDQDSQFRSLYEQGSRSEEPSLPIFRRRVNGSACCGRRESNGARCVQFRSLSAGREQLCTISRARLLTRNTTPDFLVNMSASADVLAQAKVEIDLAAIPEGKNVSKHTMQLSPQFMN